MDEELYKENILDHYRHPRNFGKPETYDVREKSSNPLCGDELTLYLAFDGETVSGARFEGDGCAISIAAGSMLTEKIKGKDIGELKLMTPGDIYTMLGIKISHTREKCALLAYATLINILAVR
ncbi:SUF system NifU family Fe-S cluster assembly protein [bacterium]|nr:SUF system NifU family Fe-S cluster assembly protein [bacterium]